MFIFLKVSELVWDSLFNRFWRVWGGLGRPLETIFGRLWETWGTLWAPGGVTLVRAMQCVPADSADDWNEYINMSSHVKVVVQKIGLLDHGVAIAVRDALRLRLRNPLYSLGDLICFICMAYVKEEEDED